MPTVTNPVHVAHAIWHNQDIAQIHLDLRYVPWFLVFRQRKTKNREPIYESGTQPAIILVACIAIVTNLGTTVSGTFSQVNSTLSS